jgi:hypothetical protein
MSSSKKHHGGYEATICDFGTTKDLMNTKPAFPQPNHIVSNLESRPSPF